MKRRPRDAAATRKAILDCAQELFVKQGFGSTSLAQIGKACRCANSLIVHHFGSKEELWTQVKDRAFAGFVEESRQIFRDQPVSLDSLRNTVGAYFRLLREKPGLVRLMLRIQMEEDAGRSRINTDQLEPFVERMRAAQAAGLLREDVPAAHLLLILIHVVTRWFEARHLFASWDRLGGGDVDERYLDSVLKIVLEGALTPSAREALA